MRTAKNKNEKGYTLLEYCAGAAVVVGALYGSLSTLGTELDKFMGGIGGWAQKRTTEVNNNN
jgi:hypothetical protein